MRAVILTGGDCFPDRLSADERPVRGDLVIAADAGLRVANALGVTPQILLGDFDSLGDPEGLGLPSSVEILRVPAEKDDTDTQLAASVALSRGADSILFVGGFGGRLDHALANLALLEDLARRRVPAQMVNGAARARFLPSGSVTIPRDPRFRFLSVFPADRSAAGVTLEGCKYPLLNATVRRRSAGFTTSNEITQPFARVCVRSGGIWIVEWEG